MSDPVRFHVGAEPEHVLRVIAAVAKPGVMGFSFSDRAATSLVGSVAKDSTFSLRRARGFMTAPRVTLLRGRVQNAQAGSSVLIAYSFHPLVRAARAALVLFFIAISLLVLPLAQADPQLLWIVVVIGLIVALMLLPFELLARQDKSHLRSEFEELLRRAGPVRALP